MTGGSAFDRTAPKHSMSTVLPNARCELKFIARGCNLPELIALVRRHRALFRESYPNRVVNNIYLDTPGLDDFQDHINGLAHRSKKRVRWYGPARMRIEKPVFEGKLRRGHISGKVSQPLPALLLDAGPVARSLRGCLGSAQLPERLLGSLRQREPSVFNRYRRHYFESANRRFRLTIDSEMRFGNAEDAGVPDERLSDAAPYLVIELKFPPECGDESAEVAGQLPFRLTRCSKYVLGIQQIRS
jgi:VTC domain